ncbi:MAG: MerR family transcriptional regulator [Bradymonadia bacterium]
MNTNDATRRGRYRIRVVSEMTGIPSPTLRAWERRYGIPSPDRSPGQYRLYSDHDVETLRRMRDLCDQGVSPSEAARLIKQRAEEVIVEPPATTPPPPTGLDPSLRTPWSVAVDRILTAVEAFDPQGLAEATRHALCLGPARSVFEYVFAPAQREVGNRWHAGRISVAHEHLASEHLTGVARDLLKLMQPSSDERLALLACFDDEQHVLPLYGSALYFVEWGFRTVVMGARTPPDALAEAVTNLDPDIVGLSLTMPPQVSDLPATLDQYAKACKGRPWMVGGRAAEPLREDFESRGATVVGLDQVKLRSILGKIARGI